MKVQTPSEAKPEVVNHILSLTEEDIDIELLRDLFASKNGSSPKYDWRATFSLPKGKVNLTDRPIRTTLGRYIINFFVFHNVRDRFDYINVPFTNKVIKGILQEMSTKLLEDVINVKEFRELLNRLSWLGYSTVSFTSPAYDPVELADIPKTRKLRKELLDKHTKEIENGNYKLVGEIEEKLIASAKEELKGKSSMDFFDSGARGSFGNNFKNVVLLRGLISDPLNPGKFLFSKSNLHDGTAADEQYMGANVAMQGAGGRALETAKSGYLSKQFGNAFQGIVVDKKGSDCKTLKLFKIKLTKENKDKFLYRFIKVDGKLIELTSKNIDSYLDKTVNMRSPLYCKSKNLCEKCAGTLPFRLGITNIGLTFNRMAEVLKNLAMKAFHDATVKFSSINISNAISEKK